VGFSVTVERERSRPAFDLRGIGGSLPQTGDHCTDFSLRATPLSRSRGRDRSFPLGWETPRCDDRRKDAAPLTTAVRREPFPGPNREE